MEIVYLKTINNEVCSSDTTRNNGCIFYGWYLKATKFGRFSQIVMFTVSTDARMYYLDHKTNGSPRGLDKMSANSDFIQLQV